MRRVHWIIVKASLAMVLIAVAAGALVSAVVRMVMERVGA